MLPPPTHYLPLYRPGIPDRVVEHGTQDQLYGERGSDAAGSAQAVRELAAKVAIASFVSAV